MEKLALMTIFIIRFSYATLFIQNVPMRASSNFKFHCEVNFGRRLIGDVTIFVKGAQNAQFFAFFLKLSVTLKTHISGTETDIDKR